MNTRAVELIKAIEQRKNTILKISSFIAEYHLDFLRNKTSHLKPLTMKTVADNISVHESTVSRTVNNKYIQTARGIFELRYFFSNKVGSLSSDAVSANSVKKMIKDLIEGEDKRNPLVDEQIKQKLEEKSISISRRTISKYREELSIPPAIKRKRLQY